jgi:hypothetical protein
MHIAFYLAPEIPDVGAGERGVVEQPAVDVCQCVEVRYVGDEVLRAAVLVAAQVKKYATHYCHCLHYYL